MEGMWVYKEIKAGLIGVIKLNMWVPGVLRDFWFYGIPTG